MSTAAKPNLRFAVGDVVRINLDTVLHGQQQTGRVLAIIERYTSKPLVRYELLEGAPIAIPADHDQYVDAAFITEVIERYSGPRLPRGRFINERVWVEKTKGTMTGWPYDMVFDVLNGKFLDIPRPLDTGKVWRMFQRDRPGVTAEVHPGLFRVNRKAFERWVTHNFRRFMMTVAECQSEADAADADYAERYSMELGRQSYWYDQRMDDWQYTADESASELAGDMQLADALDASHQWFGGSGTPHMDELMGDLPA